MNNDVKFPLMGLLVNETSITVSTRLKNENWSVTIEKIVEQNMLQKTRSLSSKRYVREIQLRADAAYDWELKELAVSDSFETKKLICYLVCLRTYNLLPDFFEEVLLRKYRDGECLLEDYEIRSFVERKAEVYPRLKDLTDATESRLRSYLIKIFKEAGLITGVRTRTITSVEVPPAFINLYKKNGAGHDLRYIIL